MSSVNQGYEPSATPTEDELDGWLGSVFEPDLNSPFQVPQRLARQVMLAEAAPVFRGGPHIVSLFEVIGTPPISIVIEQIALADGLLSVTGQIAQTPEDSSVDEVADLTGEYVLTLDGLPCSFGPLPDTGTLNLGTLAAGQYVLECLVGEQLIQLDPVRIGPPQ